MSDLSPQRKSTRTWDQLKPSIISQRTSNPIRNIMQRLDANSKNPEKSLIPLSIGDPTVFGNLRIHQGVDDALIKHVQEGKYNGYGHSCGLEDARRAIAKRFGASSFEDIFICSGCSGALEMAMGSLANEGDNILIPRPGFSLYQTLAHSKGIECRFYNLDPNKNWEASTIEMERLIDDKTRAILVNNPSNPCGCVYSKKHLQEIVALAEKYCVPIIADEIYGNIVFGENRFFPIHELTDTVPVLSTGGLAKQFLVPGWRVGWIVLYDRHDVLKRAKIPEALFRLSTLIIGANTLVQSVIPEILENTPLQFYTDLNNTLSENAQYTEQRINSIPGLRATTPQGAMYVMVEVKIDQFDGSFLDDISFTQNLLREQSVFVLPGQCFGMENFVRLVICPPKETLKVAFDRMEEFCKKHLKK